MTASSTHCSVLVVDDEPFVAELLCRFTRRLGFDVRSSPNGREALEQMKRWHPDVVLLDLQMPELSGLDVLRELRRADRPSEAILITGNAGVDTAIEAVKLGALDYLSKPVDFDRLERLLQGVRMGRQARLAMMAAEADLANQLEFCGMVGRSPQMQELFGSIRRLAPHVRSALITGETGTGKELVAKSLHMLGPRAGRRLQTVNCSAVVETLFESELFGHVRGAFTGATEHKAGVFEAADGGTLFLDEVGELPLAVQAKLLRVLELGEIQRVGSLETRTVDVRVIAATNRDLASEVEAGRFRRDLLYRLNVVEIWLAPLRDRRQDIPYLTAAFVRQFAASLNKPIRGITAPAEQILASAPFAGNVRELKNILECACMLAEGEFITEHDLASVSKGASAQRPARPSISPVGISRRREPAREDIVAALRRTGGNKHAAARECGLSRRAFYRRLERLGLSDTIIRREASFEA